MSVSLYRCDGCNESILPHKARIHCEGCVGNHNVCANCYVVGNYTKRHEESHSTSLIDKSGFQPKPPPIPPRRPLATGPQPRRPVPQQFAAPPPVIQAPLSVGLPLSFQQSTAPPPPGPPSFVQQLTASPPPGPPSFVQQSTASPPPGPPLFVQQSTASPPSGLPVAAQQPTGSPSPVAFIPASIPPTPQGGWQSLFHGSAPTATMVAFLEAVFSYLDTDKDGLLAPEQYSAFLDTQGYGPDEDVWKKNHKEHPGYTADDVADFELKTSYENFSIQHQIQARPKAATSTYTENPIDLMPFDASLAKLMKDNTQKKSFSNGMMPMLTLPGFIDITTIETLCDPSTGWIRVNRIVQTYNIWREWGDVPRSMMPEVPPKELMVKIAVITQQSVARAQGMVNASATELAFQARGQENAVRILDPPGTSYVYRYN